MEQQENNEDLAMEKDAVINQSSEKASKRRFSVSNRFVHAILTAITIISGVGMAVVGVYGVYSGLFSSQEKIIEFIDGFGFWGPAAFLVIQIVQIVIPVIPGGLTCVAGVLAFGNVMGFVYNYISIVLGSIIVFMLSRRFGMPLIQKIFPEKAYSRYENWLQKGRKFEIFFAVAIFLPLAPDDLLCYLAGLTKMTFRKYVLILIFCKPLSILAYSMGITKILEMITQFFSRV